MEAALLSELNLPAVLVAAVASTGIGAIWYGPLFGRAWIRAHGHPPERLGRTKYGAGGDYGLSFLASLVMATALAYLLAWIGAVNVVTGLWMAFVCWLGFAATTGLTGHLFSDRRSSAYLIEVAYRLVHMLTMGAILGAWR